MSAKGRMVETRRGDMCDISCSAGEWGDVDQDCPHGQRVSKGGGGRNVRGRRIDYLALRGREHANVLDISLSDGVS